MCDGAVTIRLEIDRDIIYQNCNLGNVDREIILFDISGTRRRYETGSPENIIIILFLVTRHCLRSEWRGRVNINYILLSLVT